MRHPQLPSHRRRPCTSSSLPIGSNYRTSTDSIRNNSKGNSNSNSNGNACSNFSRRKRSRNYRLGDRAMHIYAYQSILAVFLALLLSLPCLEAQIFLDPSLNKQNCEVTDPGSPDFGVVLPYCFAVHGFIYQDTRGDIGFNPTEDPLINNFGFDLVTYPIFDNSADVVISGRGFPDLVGEFFVVRGIKNLTEDTTLFPYLSDYLVASFNIQRSATEPFLWEQVAPSIKSIPFDFEGLIQEIDIRAALFNLTEDLFPEPSVV